MYSGNFLFFGTTGHAPIGALYGGAVTAGTGLHSAAVPLSCLILVVSRVDGAIPQKWFVLGPHLWVCAISF